MTKYVVCLDGTWNNASKEKEKDDGSRVYRPTNVLKVARAVHKFDDEGLSQVTYYDAGVGAMHRAPDVRTKIVRFFDNKLGGGWGAGFEINIEEAYSFLANNCNADDEIFVFGFSRGASQARSLCHLIDWVGGFPSKNDVYYVPTLFSAYLDAKGQGDASALVAAIDERNAKKKRKTPPLEPFIKPKMAFLGVWDTVLALGSRILARDGSSRKGERFHTPGTPPRSFAKIRQALAIDERRHDFQPEVWSGPGDCGDFEQRWFSGVHSNVGGGLIDDSLANCALSWICDEVMASGLALNQSYLSHFRAYAQGKQSEQSTAFKIGDTLMRPIRGFAGVRDLSTVRGITLSDSVIKRLNADPAGHDSMKNEYRPETLVQYLAANPQYDDALQPELKNLVSELRSSGK